MTEREKEASGFYLQGLAGLRSETRPQVTQVVDSFLSAAREGRIKIVVSETVATSRVAHWERNSATVFIPGDYTSGQLRQEAPRLLEEALIALLEPSGPELRHFEPLEQELARELLDAEPPIALK